MSRAASSTVCCTKSRKTLKRDACGKCRDVENASAFETHSAPNLARCYPRSFAFYLGNPFPRLKCGLYRFSSVVTPRGLVFYFRSLVPRFLISLLVFFLVFLVSLVQVATSYRRGVGKDG